MAKPRDADIYDTYQQQFGTPVNDLNQISVETDRTVTLVGNMAVIDQMMSGEIPRDPDSSPRVCQNCAAMNASSPFPLRPPLAARGGAVVDSTANPLMVAEIECRERAAAGVQIVSGGRGIAGTRAAPWLP